MIIVGEDGVLRSKCDALHARLGEGGGVAAAHGVGDVAGVLDAGVSHRLGEHPLEVRVKAGELPSVAVDDLEVVLVRDGVDVDVPAILQDVLALVTAGERDGASETRLFGAAVEVDDAAARGELVRVLLEIFGGGIRDADARRVVHRSRGRGAGVLVRPQRDEEASRDDEEGDEDVERHGEVGKPCRELNDAHELILGHVLHAVGHECGETELGDQIQLAEKHRRRAREDEQEGNDADAHLDEGGNGTARHETGRRGVLPVPARIRVGGEHDGVVILAVRGEHLAVDVLRHFLLEGEVEPRLVEEDAAHQPDESREADEEREPVQTDEQPRHAGCAERNRREQHEHRGYDARPTGIRDAAYAGAGRDKEFLLDGSDADGFELVCHVVGEFAFVVGTGQTGTYIVCRRLDDAECFVGIRSEFFSHISSLFRLRRG